MNSYCVYFLRSLGHSKRASTYIGSTNDLFRRLRQHNGEIAGGARATRRKRPWEPFAVVSGFADDHRQALSFEWHAKHPRGGRSRVIGEPARLRHALALLEQERWQHLRIETEPPFSALESDDDDDEDSEGGGAGAGRRKRKRSGSSDSSGSGSSDDSGPESSAGAPSAVDSASDDSVSVVELSSSESDSDSDQPDQDQS